MRHKALICLLFFTAFFGLLQAQEMLSHKSSKYGFELAYPLGWQHKSLKNNTVFAVYHYPAVAALSYEFSVKVEPFAGAVKNFNSYMRDGDRQLTREIQAVESETYQPLVSRSVVINGITAHRLEWLHTPMRQVEEHHIRLRIPGPKWDYTLDFSAEAGWYFQEALPYFEDIISSFQVSPVKKCFFSRLWKKLKPATN
ncbi:MAG: hypothetical protein WCY21_05930 [Candidatus Cloacimonadaceae bacterium]|jgi:hypothetical protein|nr:hypothetical protein [Candidatus Cloacimonadota bacterium]MDX9949218.1 hypothetical protein [Candidatus Syntrophosphaera sp.]